MILAKAFPYDMNCFSRKPVGKLEKRPSERGDFFSFDMKKHKFLV